MLKQLDIIIGFVVVMSVVSLLITIVTQIVSASLGWRGRNLAASLRAMFHKIDPELGTHLGALLVKEVLTHPAVSDSILSMKDGWWDRVPVIRWLRRHWKTASAIRPDEIVDLLQEFADATLDQVCKHGEKLQNLTIQAGELVSLCDRINKVVTNDSWEEIDLAGLLGRAGELKAAWANPQDQILLAKAEDARTAVLLALGPIVKVLIRKGQENAQEAKKAAADVLRAPGDETLRRKAEEAKTAVFTAISPIAPLLAPAGFAAWRVLSVLKVATPEMTVAINEIEKVLSKLAEQKGAAVIDEFKYAKNVALHNMESWFNSAQDRAQQWFTMHTRLCTVIVSFIVAFILQMDSIHLIKEISANPELRAGLVSLGTNSAFLAQAEKVLAVANLDRVDPASHLQTVTELRQRYPELRTNVPPTEALASLGQTLTWLSNQITNEAQKASITNEYQQIVERQRLDRLGRAYQQVIQTAQHGGLQLLPEPYPAVLNPRWPQDHWYWLFSGEWSWPKRRLLGILISAALLSLGAPFWFNLLKSLSNLRPVLADQVDKDPRQMPSNPRA